MSSKDEIAKRIENKIEKPMIILSLLIIPVLSVELGIITTNPSYMYLASKIDDLIWLMFLLEYLLLVSLYSNKIEYTRKNWLNVLIIVVSPPVLSPPDLASVRTLRFLRALRFLRILIPFKRGIIPIYEIFTKNSFHHVTFITVLFILISGIIFGQIEHEDIFDGVWWAITTVTTVGYGDLYPHTTYGRIYAISLMLIGIAFASLLTANIASYFVSKDKCDDTKNTIAENELILKKLDDLALKIDELDEKITCMKKT
ncbi:MAG: Voltage-gated potassium channel [Methanomethylovorans sp. PtaU1.Bin093]|uniref:potassium channel family protein n=1 Tax=Methanomethylovorans sp. PtaU1.Bin093 TaxID=1811679 RepID=UPI0009CEB8C6|nr:potassium channel family protein [Methanomethylovorans sp. PtaU1.Bin093]OPY20584.1 MAG: Voltage-gated potassium channel [Methanomethylovorans sp. PtaU1.Bin093]